MKKNKCSDKTKAKIALALNELMKTTSFEKITVSDITNQCKIHRQTFYYHFQDKYELLDWIIYNDILNPLVTDLTIDNVFGKIYDLFETMSKNKSFYQNAIKINSDDFSKCLNRVAYDKFTNIIHEIGTAHGINNADPKNTVLVAEFFSYGISGIIESWVLNGMKESPKEMKERIEMLVDSFKQLLIQRTKNTTDI